MKAKEVLELLDITQPTLGTYCKKASFVMNYLLQGSAYTTMMMYMRC